MNSAADVLDKVLTLLESSVTKTTIATWFDDATAVDLTPDRFVLHTPTSFKKDIIVNRFGQIFSDALKQIFSCEMTLLVLSGSELEAYKNSADRTGLDQEGGQEEFTFERFVVGPSNRFAHAAALAVANTPAKNYNPLFIYGGPGLGKTHLLCAIANVTRKKWPQSRIVYLKGDEFTNDLIAAIGSHSTDEFRNKYRMADLLLLDDIQFIAGKEQTQEEFFHTFNTLYEAKKQIVLTSDRPPKEIYTLEDRLRTRFEWGLLADIQAPDYETRMAIIKNKANLLGITIPEHLMQYIANSITANVRQLEGTVKKILACRNLLSMDINMDTVAQAIKDMMRDNPGIKPTAALVIDEVCKYFGLAPDMLKGPNRRKEIVFPRHVAIYIVRELTDLSLPEIGREFGGRDHSTVINSIKSVEDALRNNTETKKLITDLMNNIRER